MSGATLGALVVGGVGLVFLAAGVAIFVFGTRSAEVARARFERLLPVDATALGRLEPGRDVMLEGRISPAQPTLFRDFVAYGRYDREVATDVGPSPTPKPWTARESRTPSLLVDIRGGTARVRESYAIRGAREWKDPRTENGRETSYVGLAAAERVLVVGRVVERRPAEDATAPRPGPEREVEAEFVTPGDRADYLEGIASGRIVARWLGGGFAALGVVMQLLAAALVARARRVAA
jgi:hypothetical protein